MPTRQTSLGAHFQAHEAAGDRAGMQSKGGSSMLWGLLFQRARALTSIDSYPHAPRRSTLLRYHSTLIFFRSPQNT